MVCERTPSRNQIWCRTNFTNLTHKSELTDHSVFTGKTIGWRASMTDHAPTISTNAMREQQTHSTNLHISCVPCYVIWLACTRLDRIKQCFTSPSTQYRLYGRWFLPNQQYQSTGMHETNAYLFVAAILNCWFVAAEFTDINRSSFVSFIMPLVERGKQLSKCSNTAPTGWVKLSDTTLHFCL